MLYRGKFVLIKDQVVDDRQDDVFRETSLRYRG